MAELWYFNIDISEVKVTRLVCC